MGTAAVILAAGSSTRFGSPKQVARIGDRTIFEHVVAVAYAAGLRPVIAVVPAGMSVAPTVMPVFNDAPSAGLSHSLRLGLAAVPAEADAAVVLLGDQPTLRAETIRALLAASADGRPIVAASAQGRMGPPVLLRREAFALSDAAVGDEGLRTVLRAHPQLVTRVEVGEHAPDVDTTADLAALER